MEISNIIGKHWNIVKHLPDCSLPPVVGFCKQTSIRNILVWAAFGKTQQTSHLPPGNFKCGKCISYRQIIEGKEYQALVTNTALNFNFFATCSSSNVGYLINCLYLKLYVRSTARQLKTRMAEHRSYIRHVNQEASLVPHFLECNHSAKSFKFLALEQMQPHMCQHSQISNYVSFKGRYFGCSSYNHQLHGA